MRNKLNKSQKFPSISTSLNCRFSGDEEAIMIAEMLTTSTLTLSRTKVERL